MSTQHTREPVEPRSDPLAAPGPVVWQPVRTAVHAVFAGLAGLRGGRAFHPLGASYEGTIRRVPGSETLPFVTDDDRRALVRLSKAAGSPPRLPDVYGLSFRVPDADGPGAHQDLLLATSGELPVVRHLPVPSVGFDRRRYSSILVYRLRGRLILFGARYAGPRGTTPVRLGNLDQAVDRGEVTFELSIAGPMGRWGPVAELVLEERLSAAASEQLRFHPWNTSLELRPVGPLSHLRAPAYEASQRTATSE